MADRVKFRCTLAKSVLCPVNRNSIECVHHKAHTRVISCESTTDHEYRQCICWGDVDEDGKDRALMVKCVKV